MKTGYFLVGHGSRDPLANEEFRDMVELYARSQSSNRVDFGFIELAEPLIGPALESFAANLDRVIIIPLIFFMAGHIKRDVQLLVKNARERCPDKTFITSSGIGSHPVIMNIFKERSHACGVDLKNDLSDTSLLYIGRGSSDTESNSDLFKSSRLFSEDLNFRSVQQAFVGVKTPTILDALDQINILKPKQILVIPYLLCRGKILDQLTDHIVQFASTHSDVCVHLAGHIGVDESLVSLIDDKADNATLGRDVLPCDNCKFRVSLPEHEHDHCH